MIEVVQAFEPGKIYMGRIQHGADIIQPLESYCAENGIQHAWINFMGAVSQATISYYDQEKHQYFNQELSGEYEIVSGSGNISIKDGKPFAHLHIVLSDTQYHCFGGHLMPGTASVFACEFSLFELDGHQKLERSPDPETHLWLWKS